MATIANEKSWLVQSEIVTVLAGFTVLCFAIVRVVGRCAIEEHAGERMEPLQVVSASRGDGRGEGSSRLGSG